LTVTWPLRLFVLALLPGCQTLNKFDTTNGSAYCGAIVDAEFIRTTEADGGIQRSIRMCLELNTDKLTTVPGSITTDDGVDGPCAPTPTFQHAALTVTPAIVSDAISNMTFEDGQVDNIIAWVHSSCRGPMLSVVSLYRNDRVEVRLLKPPGTDPTQPKAADAFALFPLERTAHGF
jgi:hypothetical protein